MPCARELVLDGGRESVLGRCAGAVLIYLFDEGGIIYLFDGRLTNLYIFYATLHRTNLSTFVDYSWKFAIFDSIWGGVLTCLVFTILTRPFVQRLWGGGGAVGF